MYIIAHAQYADGKPDTKQQNLTIALCVAHIITIKEDAKRNINEA